MAGWTGTAKFVRRHVRCRPHRRLGGGQPHQKWDYIRSTLDRLVKRGRIVSTLARCKEFQQYAEELIWLAKKDELDAHRQVESIIRSSAARRILYEKLVPRYSERPYHFTRVVNQWCLRNLDGGHMALLEFVDRPGEIRPARPTGYEKRLFLYNVMKSGIPRERRKYFAQAVLEEIIDTQGKCIKSKSAIKEDTKHKWHLDDHRHSKNISDPSVTLNQQMFLISGKDGNSSEVLSNTNALVPLQTALDQLAEGVKKQVKPKFSSAVLEHTGHRMVVRESKALEQFRTPIDQRRREKSKRPRLVYRIKIPKPPAVMR